MTEFIIGNPLRRLAREHLSLRRFLWRLDFALVWSLATLFRLLPIDTASRLGARVGRWTGPRLKRKHALLRENLGTAFPELERRELERLARKAWGQAGRVLAEYPHLATILREDERLRIEIRGRMEARDNPRRPCVIVTAHQSNWEVACSAMAKLGMPNASLYTPPTNPLLDNLLLDSRAALMCRLLPRDNAARHLVRAMKQGRSAAMVMDRRVDEGRPVRFFGREKQTTLLPAKLALRFDCELVPVQVIRGKDARFRVIFHAPIVCRRPEAGEEERALDMVAQVHGLFEDWIRARPEDWFCSKRLWAKGTMSRGAGEDTGRNRHAA